MRVTKAIKEYIVREVEAKLARANEAVDESEREYLDNRKEFTSRKEELTKKFLDELNEIASEYGLDRIEMKGYYPTVVSLNLFPYRNKEIEQSMWERKNANKANSDKAIEDIIISLELGESKKDEIRALIDAVSVE